MPTTTFRDTGLGDEVIAWMPMRDYDPRPGCRRCRFKHNYPVVAPCCNCAGEGVFDDTGNGRSYFDYLNWGR